MSNSYIEDTHIHDLLLQQQIEQFDLGPVPLSGGNRHAAPVAPTKQAITMPHPISDGWDDVDEEILPLIVPVHGDVPLLYAGESNLIAGPGGVGKSWIGYAAAYSVAAAGNIAVVIDYESNIRTVRKRLKAMGVSREVAGRIMYWNPQGSLMPGTPTRAALDSFLLQYPECFLLLDSVAKALSSAGKNENDNTEYNMFDSAVFQSWTDARVTSLLIDHTGHSADPRNAPSRARGASSKNDRISGASYVFEVRDPWSKNKSGRGALKCVKDREGNRVAGEVSVDVVVNILEEPKSTGQTLEIKFYKTLKPEVTDDGTPVNRKHLEIVCGVLGEAGGVLNLTGLRDAINCSSTPIKTKVYVENAVKVLVERGFIRRDELGGRGNPVQLTLLKPYAEFNLDTTI